MYRKGGCEVGDRDRVGIMAVIDRKRKRELFHRLIDDGETFSTWLRKRIDDYVQPKKRKTAA